ncbi:MAG: ATP-grasp domain-containing protein [Clostridia bacterium]|nr:ATP-grasp domain-containing protein [Clostridia bacterium]
MKLEKYNISIKRDVLRLNKEGKLSRASLPKTIGTNNKFIKETDEKYMIEVETPVSESLNDAYEKLEEIINVVTEELYNKEELIWAHPNYEKNDVKLAQKVSVKLSFDDEFLDEFYKKNKTFKIKRDKLYEKAKEYIDKNKETIEKTYGSFKVRNSSSSITFYGISIDEENRYGVTKDQVYFLIALLFSVLDTEKDELFKKLSKVDKKYNLKAEEAIKLYKKNHLKVSNYDFNKLLKKSTKYMYDGYMQRYSIQNHDALVAESKVIIKDAIAQGVDYKILNEAKSIVEFYNKGKKEIVIEGNRTNRDCYIFENITNDKYISKQIMKEAGLVVPEAIILYKSMTKADIEELVKPFYNKKIVVKPRNTNYGIGITVFSENATKTQIMNAIEYAFRFDDNILIEQYCKGLEYRFLVINGKCLSVVHRRNASVIGDGKSTIRELIKMKNKEDWHALTGSPIKTDEPVVEYLKIQGLTYDSVIPEGKRITLRSNSNVSTGGESLVFTDIMPDRFKKIAEKASRAFDAKICGVDIIIEDMKKDKYAIIEINDNPGYSINEWPYEGKGEKIGVSILKLLSLV